MGDGILPDIEGVGKEVHLSLVHLKLLPPGLLLPGVILRLLGQLQDDGLQARIRSGGGLYRLRAGIVKILVVKFCLLSKLTIDDLTNEKAVTYLKIIFIRATKIGDDLILLLRVVVVIRFNYILPDIQSVGEEVDVVHCRPHVAPHLQLAEGVLQAPSGGPRQGAEVLLYPRLGSRAPPLGCYPRSVSDPDQVRVHKVPAHWFTPGAGPDLVPSPQCSPV